MDKERCKLTCKRRKNRNLFSYFSVLRDKKTIHFPLTKENEDPITEIENVVPSHSLNFVD